MAPKWSAQRRVRAFLGVLIDSRFQKQNAEKVIKVHEQTLTRYKYHAAHRAAFKYSDLERL